MLSIASIIYNSTLGMCWITCPSDGTNLSKRVESWAATKEIWFLLKLKVDTSKVSLRIPIGTFLMSVILDSISLNLTLVGKTCVLVAPDHLNPKKFMKLIERMGLTA